MAIVGGRIDNRLLHGIVATQWAPQSGATRVMVVDDEVANNPITKESMKLARPTGMAVSIITKETALTNFKAGKYDTQKVFVISKEPDIFLELLNNQISMKELVLGGTAVPENTTEAIKVSSRAYVLNEQKETYKQIMEKGVTVTIRFAPGDKANNLKTFI